jgi:outer membrane lipoprotein
MNRGAFPTRPVWLLFALLAVACASQVPLAIRQAPEDNPSVDAVRENAAEYEGRKVRWGGRLIETENRENATWLIVLAATSLSKDGEPPFGDEGGGRFIAIVPEFLDPKVYAANRKVTVTGTVLRTEIRPVGKFPYTYPVVQATAWYLWPEDTAPPYYGYPYPPWWYNPWYGPGLGPWYANPWYPYGYPYWP